MFHLVLTGQTSLSEAHCVADQNTILLTLLCTCYGLLKSGWLVTRTRVVPDSESCQTTQIWVLSVTTQLILVNAQM